MADDELVIPLFPLNLVLFPGMVQPLHIFETRYREMTRFCLDSTGAFGIALAEELDNCECGAPARIGALAHISNYQRLEDGRYNLITVGAQRFEILETYDDRLYARARVRLLPEAIGEGDIAGVTRDARRLLDDYLTLVLSQIEGGDANIPVPHDSTELSYFIAVCLPCDDTVKQGLLEALTTTERLTLEVGLLHHEIEVVSQQLLDEQAGDEADVTVHADARWHLN